jgi:predicted Zn-dependent peptidase
VRLAGSLPAYAARAALLRHCFGDHPVTRETPAHADVEAVTAGQVARLHAAQVVPAGSVLVVVGDVQPHRLAGGALVGWPGTWSAAGVARRMAPLPGPAAGPVVEVVRAGARQTEVRLLASALSRTDPDYAVRLRAGRYRDGAGRDPVTAGRDQW